MPDVTEIRLVVNSQRISGVYVFATGEYEDTTGWEFEVSLSETPLYGHLEIEAVERRKTESPPFEIAV